MKLFRLAAVCSAVIVMGACGSRDTALTTADRDAIRAASQKYVEADDKRDLEGVMEHIAEGAVYVPAGMPPLVGREAIRAFVKPHPWETVVQVPQEIEGRDGLAFVRGSDTVHIQGMTITGNYIEIWQKQMDGAWKITRKVWNTDRQ